MSERHGTLCSVPSALIGAPGHPKSAKLAMERHGESNTRPSWSHLSYVKRQNGILVCPRRSNVDPSGFRVLCPRVRPYFFVCPDYSLCELEPSSPLPISDIATEHTQPSTLWGNFDARSFCIGCTEKLFPFIANILLRLHRMIRNDI